MEVSGAVCGYVYSKQAGSKYLFKHDPFCAAVFRNLRREHLHHFGPATFGSDNLFLPLLLPRHSKLEALSVLYQCVCVCVRALVVAFLQQNMKKTLRKVAAERKNPNTTPRYENEFPLLVENFHFYGN